VPVISCPESTPCIDPASPITNYSTEAPDPNIWISLRFPWIDPDNPVGPDGPNTPPNVFTGDGCQSECTSQVSQAEADLCAALQAALCVDGGSGNPVFTNTQQQCSVNCPDGNQFTYTVPAGVIANPTQFGANAQAAALACELLKASLICIDDIQNEACVGQAFSTTITATSALPVTFSVNGILPIGLVLIQTGSRTARLSGTPTLPGSRNFSIVATDARGDFMSKPVTFCVIDITPSILSNGTTGTVYSQALSATPCAGTPLSWQVTSGSLPPGLTLDSSTGVISGTPTTAGTYNFTVTLQTHAT
jgi:putative Ig domain-containing protein